MKSFLGSVAILLSCIMRNSAIFIAMFYLRIYNLLVTIFQPGSYSDLQSYTIPGFAHIQFLMKPVKVDRYCIELLSTEFNIKTRRYLYSITKLPVTMKKEHKNESSLLPTLSHPSTLTYYLISCLVIENLELFNWQGRL